MCEIWLKSVHRGLLYDYVKYNEFVSFCTFPFLSFFLVVAYSKNDQPILTRDSSYDAVSRKEVPFGVTIISCGNKTANIYVKTAQFIQTL